jgi:hypothetical protein
MLAPSEPIDARFAGCEGGCGTRATGDQAGVVRQPGARIGQQVFCPVSGVVLNVTESTPHRQLDDGSRIYLCCEACAGYFDANRDLVLAKRRLSRS